MTSTVESCSLSSQSLAGKQITQSAGASDVMQAAFDVLSVTKEGLASVK